MPRASAQAKVDHCRHRAAGTRRAVARHLWLSAAGHYEAALQHLERAAQSEKAADRYEREHGGAADADDV